MKDVVGYEGQYAVTEDGKIWSYKRKEFMSVHTIKSGYLRTTLRDSKNGNKNKSFLVHRLVAMAFLENKEQKKEVNHKNNVRNDNNVTNLEWVTRSENNKYAWEYGNKKFVKTQKYLESVRKNIAKARQARMIKLTERNNSYAT